LCRRLLVKTEPTEQQASSVESVGSKQQTHLKELPPTPSGNVPKNVRPRGAPAQANMNRANGGCSNIDGDPLS
jgi:hypothetical protein